MQTILTQIKALPGVIGAAVYSNKKGILAANLPKIYTDEKLQSLGKDIHEVFTLNKSAKLDFISYEVQYDGGMLMVRNICKVSSLIILCAPETKTNLITMSAAIVLSDLRNLIPECN